MNKEPETQNKEPETQAEWQEAVNVSKVMLLVHDARLYGLIRGGPSVDVERCQAMINGGQQRGIRPQPEEVDRFIVEMAKPVIVEMAKPGGGAE